MLNGENILRQLLNVISASSAGKMCIGSETIQVTSSVKHLTVPEGATSADMTLECSGGSTDPNVAMRYTLDGKTPSAAISGIGMPIGDYDTIEISNGSNLTGMRFISADGVTKYLKVIYYK